jgi:hypothetical protein
MIWPSHPSGVPSTRLVSFGPGQLPISAVTGARTPVSTAHHETPEAGRGHSIHWEIERLHLSGKLHTELGLQILVHHHSALVSNGRSARIDDDGIDAITGDAFLLR